MIPKLSLSSSTTASQNLATSAPKEVNESLFSYLFSEIVRFNQNQVETVDGMEASLSEYGYQIGFKMLELISIRTQAEKREIKHLPALQFVTSSCWKSLFGKNADSLERSNDGESYLIHERDPLPMRYASVPKELSRLNLASFNAGITRGLLEAQGFPCTVVAHLVAGEGKVIYVVRFDKTILQREARYAS